MALGLGLSEELASALTLQGFLFFILVLVAALVATGEFSLIGISAVRRRQLEDEEHPGIGRVERILSKPRRLLVTVLVSKTALRVSTAVVAAQAGAAIWGGPGLVAGAAVAIVTLLVFTDLLPRAIAARNPEGIALTMAPVFLAFEKLLAPIWWVAERGADAIFRMAGVRPDRAAAQFRSEEELKTLIALGTEEGILEEGEEEMIQSVIELGDTVAKEVMVPRIDMVAVPGDATLDVIKPYVLESGYSRIPVYQGNLDNVIGVLYVKDMLLSMVEKKGPTHARDLMREPIFVPESMGLGDLLSDMREKRRHMAIVVDEFGGTAGMVTLEDILEEIVGEIFDEYDLRNDPVRRLDANTAVVDARTHVADINDALDIEIPEDEAFDTVAGYVQHELGRLGKEGEIVHGPGFDVIIEKATPRRILRARVITHSEVGGTKADS